MFWGKKSESFSSSFKKKMLWVFSDWFTKGGKCIKEYKRMKSKNNIKKEKREAPFLFIG